MSETLLVAVFLVFALIMFVTEKLRYDITALLVLFGLGVTGLLAAEELFAGFASPAVITVAALSVISAAFGRAGLVQPLSSWLGRRAKNPLALAVLASLIVALLSGFMNNIAAMTILLPVVVSLCRTRRWPPSVVLIPLAFGAIVGGTTTLIGTPANLLAANMLQDWGYEPLGFFELTPLGLILVAVMLAFFALFGIALLPVRPTGDSLAQEFGIANYLIEAQVPVRAIVAGMIIADSPFRRDFDATILGIIRGDAHLTNPGPQDVIEPGDILLVEVPRRNLVPMTRATGIQSARPGTLERLVPGDAAELTDVAITAASPLIGQTLKQADFRNRYNLQVLAIGHRGQNVTERFADLRLDGGDVLLVLGAPDVIDRVADDLHLVLLERENLPLGGAIGRRVLWLFAVMIVAVSWGLVPIALAALGTAALMVASGCLPIRDAYRSIPWSVLVLIGCMSGLATAVHSSGLTSVAASALLRVTSGHPTVFLALLFVAGCVLASIVTPVAAILLLGPLAYGVATASGAADPRAYLIVTTVAVSAPFLSPFGHQCSVLVYTVGNYRFADYVKVGLPLCAALLLASLMVIPRLWPL